MLMARSGKPYLLDHCETFFYQHSNTLLPLWQSLMWLGYEIVFCFVNDIIDDSILFSQFYSTAHRVCAKTATDIHNGPALDVRNEAPSKICMRPDASATWKKNRCSSCGESFCCMKNTPCWPWWHWPHYLPCHLVCTMWLRWSGSEVHIACGD